MHFIIIFFVFMALLRALISMKKFKSRNFNKNKIRFLKNRNLKNKTVLITGGNKGIGLATAAEFSSLGAKVIIGSRNKDRGEMAVKLIKRKFPKSEVCFKMLDLASFKSVENLVENVLKCNIKIDFLVNNAAIMTPFQLTEDNLETQFEVNYLSHFYLTRLLLKKSVFNQNARIVHVSSAMHKYGKIDFGQIKRPSKNQSKYQIYNNTKLMNILFSNELSIRLNDEKSSILSISLHPGVIYTDFQNHFVPKFLVPFTRAVVKTFAEEPASGSFPILYACLEEKMKEKKCVYLYLTNWVTTAKCADWRNKKVRSQMKKLWNFSSKILNLHSESIFKKMK